MIDPALFGQSRRVAGVMSGTSLDGIDVAVATIEGDRLGLQIRDVTHHGEPYSELVRETLLRNSRGESSSVIDVSQLNVMLAHLYAGAITRASDGDAIDLVGLHGQTIQHVPELTECAGHSVRSTLQIGDASTLANLLGVPVVGDFRMADMAVGGQGAPLVPYFDFVALTDPIENRLALNLGGIANFTLLPAANSDSVPRLAMDTGPANMVMDALASRVLGERFDDGGRLTATGSAKGVVVRRLLDDPYFQQPPPKTTGREYFGQAFVDRMVGMPELAGASAADLLATAAELTAQTVAYAYQRFVLPTTTVDRVIASGGGTQNEALMNRLRAAFDPVPVDRIDDHGIPSSAKEALCFAVLAHEYINGVPTNVPEVTGALRPARLGKLSLP